MSAAAPPTPPPHRVPVPRQYDSRNAPRDIQQTNGTHTEATSGYQAHASGQRKAYPHLQDLVIRANTRTDPNTSIEKLLETAHRSLKAAQSSLEFNRPDHAYSEYLTAYNILVSTIPRHRDALILNDRPNLGKAQRQLIKDINALQPRFQAIHDTIVADNRMNNTQQTESSLQSHIEVSGAYERLPQVPTEWPAEKKNLASRLSVNPNGIGTSPSPPGSNRFRPPVQPKPQNLHGTAINSQSQTPNSANGASNTDALSARFAMLRTGSNLSSTTPPSQGDELHGIEHDNYSRSQQSARASTPSLHVQTNGLTNGAGFSMAAERHLRGGATTDSTMNKDLPKLPSPTYSPGRGSGTPIQPPRSARTSTIYTGGSSSSFTSSTSSNQYASSHAPGRSVDSVPQSLQPGNASNSDRPGQPTRRKSMHVSFETEITAETLYDYLKIYNVLIIDVRTREDYDAGHIFTRNGICIEPTALRESMSAEELNEALVVSPDDEEVLFDQRHKFDLVVYYDQSSNSTDFLRPSRQSRSNISLKYLHDALYEFNHEKPLQYPPIFLIGGVDAWVDLLGPQALKTSNTASRSRAAKAGRPLARRPAINGAGRLSVQKKRRDYNPLAPGEEKEWRERARSESYVLDSQPQVEDLADEDEEQTPAYARNLEDFWRRYPEIAAVERQSMTTPTPRVPQYPAPPSYQAPPPPPSYQPPPVPQSPSRPPPIAQRPSYSGVSERALSQNMPATKAPHLPAYIPPKLKRLPRTGLFNFGATCYMNATIQCLSATIPMTAFFLDGRFDKYVQKDNWKGSKGIMPELYTNLLRNLWQPNGVDTIRPTNFRKMCARLNKEWASDRQQDAKEFLEFLVDVLHEDLNVNWNRTPLRQLTSEEEEKRERLPSFIASMKEWSRYEHRDHSRLTDLFAGQHISRLQCTTCRRNSTTYEPFYSISVEIPPPSKPGRSVTLDDCLRSYCASEMLSGEDVWRCPHCNASREAIKQITISRAPEFLIVHFKRFSASISQSARKVHTPVDFPLEDLDLEPYMLPAPTLSERDQITKSYGEEALRDPPRSMTRPFRYDAYAVMRHLGASMGSGHYIGIVRDAARGCWREFNDERIGDFRPEELPWEKRLQNEMAYIVFYQRVAV